MAVFTLFYIIPYRAVRNQVSSVMFLRTPVQKRKTVCIHTAAKKTKREHPLKYYQEVFSHEDDIAFLTAGKYCIGQGVLLSEALKIQAFLLQRFHCREN